MILQTPHDIVRHLRNNPGEFYFVLCPDDHCYRVCYRPAANKVNAPFEVSNKHGSRLFVNNQGLEIVLGQGSFELLVGAKYDIH